MPTRRSWLRASVLAPLTGAVAAAATDPGPQSAPATPRGRIQQRYLPNVVLRTHENRRVRFYDDLVKNKVVAINFMYAECEGICPGITMNLAKVQRLLGRRVGHDIFMYSITLQPQRDSPAVLADYARMHGAQPGWTFLTGAPPDIELLRRSLGFVDPDPAVDRDQANHIGVIRYGNEPRLLWAACPGMTDATWVVELLSGMARRV